MRLLVTGAFGYLGLALTRRLAESHALVAFGHPPRSDAARAVLPRGITVVEGDMLDVAAVVAAHGPFDVVLHLAGGAPERVERDPTAAVRSEVLGAAQLCAVTRGARTLFASSIDVHGTRRAPPGGRPYRETDATSADDLFGALKEATEAVVIAAGGTAIRLADVHGAGAGVDLGSQGAAWRFARAAAAGDELPLADRGARRIDTVHIDDVCDALVAALAARELPPILNIASGAPITVGELASACLGAAHKLGRKPRIVLSGGDGAPQPPERSLAIGLAGNLLGWRPRVKLQQGIDSLVATIARSPA